MAMSQEIYDLNIENIKRTYKTPEERKSALDQLNSIAQTWEPPATAAPVSPVAVPKSPNPQPIPTGARSERQRRQSKMTAKQADEVANMSAVEKAAYTANLLAIGATGVALPGLLTGGVGAGLALGRPILKAAAEKGLMAAGGVLAKEGGKGALRVLGNAVPAWLASQKAGDIAEDMGAGPNVQTLVRTIAGAGTALATNKLVNKVLPQELPLNVARTDSSTWKGFKPIQKAHDFVESNLQPGGAAAWFHPDAEEAMYLSNVKAANRLEDIQAPARQAFKEIKSIAKKEKLDGYMDGVRAYLESPTKDTTLLDPKLRTRSIIKGLDERNARFNAFTDANEMDYADIAKDVLVGSFKQKGVKKQDMLNHIADLLEGRAAASPQELIDLDALMIHSRRSPRAAQNLIKALRDPANAQRGSVRWNEAKKAYLPQVYDYKREGVGWTSDPTLREAAIVEQIANAGVTENGTLVLNRKSAQRMIDAIKANRSPGTPRLEPLQNAHFKPRKLERGTDDALMKYLGIVDDPEFLMEEATRRLTSNAARRGLTNDLIKQGVLSRDPSKFKDSWRVTVSGSNTPDPDDFFMRVTDSNIAADDIGDAVKGFNYYAPKTMHSPLIKDSGNWITRTMGNLTGATRDAKVIQNIPGQIRNAMGDMSQEFLAGASVKDMPSNLRWAYRNQRLIAQGDFGKADPLYRAFREVGSTGGGFAHNLGHQPAGRSTYRTIKNRVGPIKGAIEGRSAQLRNTIQRVPGARSSRAVAEIGEETRRMAFARDAFKRFGGVESAGFSNTTAAGRRNMEILRLAAKEVERVLVPYDRPSNLVRGINAFFPVSSWAINSAMAAPGLFLENPGRAIALRYAMKGTNELLDRNLDIKANFNQNMPGGEVYEAMDAMNEGVPASIALRDAFKGMVTPGLNPYVRMLEAYQGFTTEGYPIVNDTSPLPMQLALRLGHVGASVAPQNYQQMAPYLKPKFKIDDAPGGPLWNALTNQKDKKYGMERTTNLEALLRVLGAPIQRSSAQSIVKEIDKQKRRVDEVMRVDPRSTLAHNELQKLRVLLERLRREAGENNGR